MKKVLENKIYYLKKNQNLLSTNRKAGEKATFEWTSNNAESLVFGSWVNESFNGSKPSICLKRYEFFKVFSDKP